MGRFKYEDDEVKQGEALALRELGLPFLKRLGNDFRVRRDVRVFTRDVRTWEYFLSQHSSSAYPRYYLNDRDILGDILEPPEAAAAHLPSTLKLTILTVGLWT